MNFDKAQIKLLISHEIGMRMDDYLEAAKKECDGFSGAKQALQEAIKRLDQHLIKIDLDVKENRLMFEYADIVKKYVDQCGGIVRNLLIGVEVQFFQAQGKIIAFEQSVKSVKQIYDAEKIKIETAKDILTQPNIDDKKSISKRVVGAHPGDPLISRRNLKVVNEDIQKVKIKKNKN